MKKFLDYLAYSVVFIALLIPTVMIIFTLISNLRLGGFVLITGFVAWALFRVSLDD